MKLTFWGAAMEVTGSCHMLEINGKKILIDCGMFQGSKVIRALNRRDFPFKPSEIDCVLLTHAHIDHSGLLPKLCKSGFRGKIYATKATTQLCSIMLPDSAHIQEFDAEIESRKGQRAGRVKTEPLYTVDDAYSCLKRFSPVEYGVPLSLGDGSTVTFRDAGHILGSSMLDIIAKEGSDTTHFLFSGDLGRPSQPIIKDPEQIATADFIVMESTYGDRDHSETDWPSHLAEIINDTVKRGGNIIIPAFAVGRTQIILYYLHQIFKEKRIPDMPVFIDSPLAISATDIFMHDPQDYDQEAIAQIAKENENPLSLPQLQFTRTTEESRALNQLTGPAIIISASGMADAGRILHHLKHNLWRPESSVLFVGYQAEGTLGRRLVEGVNKVRIMGEEIKVRAKIYNLEGLSAHADRDEILSWLEHLSPKPANVFLVHGETTGTEGLTTLIKEKLAISTYAPVIGDAAAIKGRTWEIIPSTLPPIQTPAKQLQDYLNEMDNGLAADRQRLEQLMTADASKIPLILARLEEIRKFTRKTLANL